jgi:DNA-binding MarR family transcriptional regulator
MPAVPCEDAFRWHRVGPHALIIMLVLKRWQTIGGPFPTVIGDQLLGEIGILPQTRDRALAALEKAGFVRVDRHRRRLPRIWLAEPERLQGAA